MPEQYFCRPDALMLCSTHMYHVPLSATEVLLSQDRMCATVYRLLRQITSYGHLKMRYTNTPVLTYFSYTSHTKSDQVSKASSLQMNKPLQCTFLNTLLTGENIGALAK